MRLLWIERTSQCFDTFFQENTYFLYVDEQLLDRVGRSDSFQIIQKSSQ